MALRAPLDVTTFVRTGTTVGVRSGIRLYVYDRGTTDEVTGYTTETGSTTVTYPLVSNVEGQYTAWYEFGQYDLYSPDDTINSSMAWDAIPAGASSGGGGGSSGFYPGDYGGDPTGTSDSTTAIQDALDAAAAVDGTVNLGTGDAIWKYSSQLTIDSAVRLTSDAAGGRGGSGKATLRFTGTGTSSAFLVNGKQRLEIDHVEFDYNNTGFTGPLFLAYGEPSDIINMHVHHCDFRAISGIATLSAACLMQLHNVIFSKISECSFNGAADNLIRIGRVDGSSYCNGVTITDCAFNDTANEDRGQICIYAGDVEALLIQGCGFEGASPNNLTPIRGANSDDAEDTRTNLIYSMTVRNCWSGDAGGAGPDNGFALGLNGQADFGPIVFQDNFIAPSGGTAVTAGQTGAAFVFIGNHQTQGILSGSGGWGGGYKALYLYNSVGGGEVPVNDSLFAIGDEPTAYSRLGQADTHVTGRLGVAHHVDFDDLTTWPTDETMVIGGHVPNASGLLAIGDRVAIYSRDAGTGDRSLALQASDDDDNNEVQIVAGTTPAPKIRANGTGIGFYGQTPVSRPDYTTSNVTTDRTFDANATTTDELADVLGTLIADLIAVGLIQ
jgi:hypothetical protein